MDDDEYYHGPPGYDNILLTPMDNENYMAYKFSQQCLAQFIGVLARGIKRPNSRDNKIQMIWRGRTTQKWDYRDPEQSLFPEDCIRNNAIYNNRSYDINDHDNNDDNDNNETDIMELNIELLRQLHHSDEMDIDNNSKEASITSYLNQFELITNRNFGPINNTVSNITTNALECFTTCETVSTDQIALLLRDI